MPTGLLAILVPAYILAGRLTIRQLKGTARDAVFGILNLAALYGFFFYGHPKRFCIYVTLVCGMYLTLRLFGRRTGACPWLAFAAPILLLVFVRYLLPVSGEMMAALGGDGGGFAAAAGFQLLGISYLAFRSSHLVLEVRNEIVPMPGLWRYLGFCFFAPTLSVGPINPYSNHVRAFESDTVTPGLPAGRALMRILVGLVKFQFLGNYFNQLSYDGLLMDDHFHHWIDLPIASVFYYLYLYCNFSGYCDAAIGVAGLMGVPVAENFNNPLAARNVKDFWNRWHITLSTYMRDVVFSPLSKWLGRMLGPSNINHAIALTITVIFLLIGVWHGLGWNYAAFGAVHALAVVANHYYTVWLKRVLGREGFKKYNSNHWIHGMAVVMTFAYVAASLMLFANRFSEIRDLLNIFGKS